MSDDLAKLLAEALDLCVRARALDAQTLQAEMAKFSPCEFEGTRSGTPHLWVQEQYEVDLTDWEVRARNALRTREAVE